MFRKNYFTFLLAIVLFSAGSIAVSAQLMPVTGKVEMKKADGTTVPVADATVDLIRTDIKSTILSTKTNKDGAFNFAGIPPEAVFVLSVSAPNANPEYYPDLVPGLSSGFGIVLSAGNGRRLTEAEILKALSASTNQNSQNAKLTAEQKKKQQEEQKKIDEINSKNTKSKEADGMVKKALDEGRTAFEAKNYDVAIVKFDEGYKASPDYVGSAPVLLNNKALALRLRGSVLYNQSRELTDVNAKMENMKKVTQDFADSAESYNLSWTVSKNTPAADIQDQKNYEANKLQSLRGIKDLVKVMVTTEKIDNSKTGVIKALVQEYIAIETDKTAKAEAQVGLADIYRLAGDPDNAIAEYRKALELSPDNPDALAGLGLSLFDAGERSGNTAQKQEGLNYMQRFADTAPSNHKLKESVAGAVEYLKSQKLTPQKNTKKKN